MMRWRPGRPLGCGPGLWALNCGSRKLGIGSCLLTKFTPAVVLAVLMGSALAARQGALDTPDAHVALARAAAGDRYQNLFTFLCAVPTPRAGGPATAAPRGGGP